MKIEAQFITPDVECVQVFPYSEQNEVNERIARHGWVLLCILVTRDFADNGTFRDRESYVIGLKRGGGR